MEALEVDGGRTVPRPLRGTLYLILVIGGLLSVPRVGEFTLLPMTALLDVWIVVLVLVTLFRGRIAEGGIFLLLLLFLSLRLVPALATAAPLEDTLQAFRWVLYLLAFCCAVGRRWGPIGPLINVMWALLLMALIKAMLTLVILGPGQRPGLLLENNFELALFSGLIAVLYWHIPRYRLMAVSILGLTTVLSGSRSGAAAFAVLAIFALVNIPFRNNFYRYLALLAVPAIVLVPVWVFSSRFSSLEQLDRFRFFEVFQAETRDWTFSNWLFGTFPITPLSSSGCMQLSYYQQLFSSEGNGECYSVILHSFILRVVFDTGFTGLLLAFGLSWWLMRRAGVPRGVRVALIAIAVTNSFSVSGLNNPYVALPIILAILGGSLDVRLGATGLRRAGVHRPEPKKLGTRSGGNVA